MEFFLGQIVWFAFSFAPKQFALCNGQLLPISSNQALFTLLGTAFGGDGRNTFGLPNIQGRVALGLNNVPGTVPNNPSHPTYLMAAQGGEEFHTLTLGEIPGHIHNLTADGSTAGGSNGGSPGPSVVLGASADAGGGAVTSYGTPPLSGATLNPNSIGSSTGGQGHENRMPYVVLSACICLNGIYPSRN